MGVVWTVQPFWSHHPRYPLPEMRVAAPCVEGDFRVEVCIASATSSTQTSASLCPYQHYAHLHCPIHFRLPTFSRTMHHTSSQKGLRSGWQSGASEPHLLTRRCSNRRKFCGPSAPIAYATSGIFCKEAGAMVAAWKRLLTDECYSIFSSTQSSGTVQKSPGISFLSNTTNAPPSGTMCHLIFHLPSS